MKRKLVIDLAEHFWETTPFNQVPPERAISPELAGMTLYDRPIAGVASAKDPAFLELLKPEAVGPHMHLPDQWLPGAKSVVSFFFPSTESIRRANAREKELPAPEWLHGRVEGQAFLTALGQFLQEELGRQGVRAVVPAIDPRFWQCTSPKEPGGPAFTSNWSERHAAYVCGLGTFGLSKGLITEKGMAGRFASVIVDLEMETDQRPYDGLYTYCTQCGACVRNCPAGAIHMERGKDHQLCSAFLEDMLKRYAPWYGCGKCQVNVPCEHQNPVAVRKKSGENRS